MAFEHTGGPAITPGSATPPVLVVIADAEIRQVVGWVVAQMELTANLKATWREAYRLSTERPACVIVDLDDVDGIASGIAVLQESWGGGVPLIVLSRRPDVGERAAAFGARFGIRKPVNVGALMDAIHRAVGERTA